LEFLRGVSHLGDWFFMSNADYEGNPGARPALDWERDGFQYLASYQPYTFLRLYGGGGAWLSTTPAAPPLYLHAGAELFTSYSNLWGAPWRGYFAYDLKINDLVMGVADQTFQAGLQLRGGPETGPGLRAALTYTNGNDPFGQFYLQKDNRWLLGLFIDP
jgi:hypothetical protein